MPSERTKTFTLILCCLAQFMVVLDVSIVNVALPSIRSDLDFTAAELQWIVNAYTLTFAGFLLLGGRAADLLGRRRVFMAGMLLFALASLVGGLAEDKLTLVIARAIQGLGGAVVAPATLSILATTFTDRSERNKALGLVGCDGRPRRGHRRLAGGRADADAELALGPVHQPADRAVRGLRRLARGARGPRRAARAPLRPGRAPSA